MSTKTGWGEEEWKKALRAFRRTYPEWAIDSNTTRCPECTVQYPRRRVGLNFCKAHRWANENWLTGGKGAAMISLLAFGDQRLRSELGAEGIGNY